MGSSQLDIVARRQHRATWTATELMLTFPTPVIKAVTVLPLSSEDTAGRFRVWLSLADRPPLLMWDRKIEGSFPELKVLVSSSAAHSTRNGADHPFVEAAYTRSCAAGEVAWPL